MKNLRIRSASEQLADFLKEQIRNRKWTSTMPGESWLVTQMGVGRDTVRAAMSTWRKKEYWSQQGKVSVGESS